MRASSRPTCGRGRPSRRRGGRRRTSARRARGRASPAASSRSPPRSGAPTRTARACAGACAIRRGVATSAAGLSVRSAEQQLVAEVRAHRRDRGGRSSTGASPAARIAATHASSDCGRRRRRPARRGSRQRGEVAPVGIDRARRALRGEQEQVALHLGVGRRRRSGVVMRLDPIRRACRVVPAGHDRGMTVVVDAAEAARVDVAVDLRRRERGVPEQLLDRAQVGAALEQVRGVRVPEPVRVAHQPAEDATCRARRPRTERKSASFAPRASAGRASRR